MSRAFTHYWIKSNNVDTEGTRIRHIASSKFSARGVESGSRVYCVNVHKGKLRLVARIVVDQVVSGQEAENILGTTVSFWDRGEHCVCTELNGTHIRFDREVPLSIAELLRFESTSGREGLVIHDGNVDGQTVRSIRELTRESAESLDRLLDEPSDK